MILKLGWGYGESVGKSGQGLDFTGRISYYELEISIKLI
jgi:hypothetical protein